MATRRQITLSESPNAPTLDALCDDLGWNGFHVPLLTAETLARHLRALAANDHNGTWAEVVITEDDGHVRMHDCEAAGCGEEHDHSEDYLWPLEGPGAWIDGLTWSDPTTDEDA